MRNILPATTIASLLLLPLALYSCSSDGTNSFGDSIADLFRPSFMEPPFTCSVTTFMDKDFDEYLNGRAERGLPTRVGIMSFNVPKNFSPVAAPINDGYGAAIATKFREQFLKHSPNGIFEFFSAEQVTFEESKRDFERTNVRLMSFATNKGYDTLVLGQLNNITNSSELNFSVKIIDLGSQITVWSGETIVATTAKSKNVNETNQSLFYFEERISKAAECAVKTMLKKTLE